MARKVGLTHPPTIMKMDIEGFEWSTIPAIIKSGFLVPDSFSFELHYGTRVPSVPWFGRMRSEPELGLLGELLVSLGYVLVDRNDNQAPTAVTWCSEVVIAKLLPNTRFHNSRRSAIHHRGAKHESLLNVLPYPTPTLT